MERIPEAKRAIIVGQKNAYNNSKKLKTKLQDELRDAV